MVITCAACGAEHPAGARFCSACGAPLLRPCPVCAAEQPVSAAFCSACGSALGDPRRVIADTRQERRIVSALFADLAGSTALGERLDPEEVRALQGAFFDAVNGCVERFGGVTEKFAGDAILAVFGIPTVHEDDPERAVRAALAMRDELGAGPFGAAGVRIGVNTGEVVTGREAAARGELMVSGDAVNVAARLQQHAQVGQVLVGRRTHAATQRTIAYEPVTALAAKGKVEPVEAWAALHATAEPAERSSGFDSPLVGRDEELAVLTAVAARVERDSAPQLVTLLGSRGSGSRASWPSSSRGFPEVRVLQGRCLPYEGVTYAPLVEAVRGHAEAFAGDGDALAPLIGAGHSASGDPRGRPGRGPPPPRGRVARLSRDARAGDAHGARDRGSALGGGRATRPPRGACRHAARDARDPPLHVPPRASRPAAHLGRRQAERGGAHPRRARGCRVRAARGGAARRAERRRPRSTSASARRRRATRFSWPRWCGC